MSNQRELTDTERKCLALLKSELEAAVASKDSNRIQGTVQAAIDYLNLIFLKEHST